jgi:hypothetical protein
MNVFVVLYKSNYGDGTSTSIDSVFEDEGEAVSYVDSQEGTFNAYEWFEIQEKELK